MPGASFTGLRLAELSALLGSHTRALAARKWLFGVRPLPSALPPRIPGVSAGAWSALRERAPLPDWRVGELRQAPDGTTKLALALGPATVETVLIPAQGRSTVCVSSQAGCTRDCRFCATATLGFSRALSAAEIVLQYAVAAALAGPAAPARNVVFMGMGEPMDNLDEVLAAVEVLTDAGAPGLSPSHVTVSTSGVLPGMTRFLGESRAHLALSLNATTDEQRERLMPHNRAWPIAALLEALRQDHARGSRRRYFIEYVLWEGVNDTDEDAARLAALLRALPAHVNLIPHNVLPGNPLRPPAGERVIAFQRGVRDGGVRCLVRWPRGEHIAAACGQLAPRAGRAVSGR
ncbi:MAG TPA: 23S rRNA (adenine(2503)-C(2))-methyltransferase RlmN [Vicinamibacteria bacterium]|nr:23S rRNA (adenine(2503)-C(2))-methyltransferase RlmN [Vicinamibacteria bacterium]